MDRASRARPDSAGVGAATPSAGRGRGTVWLVVALLILAVGAGTAWLIWENGDRSRGRNLADVPPTLCAGLVDPGDVTRLTEVREADRVESRNVRLPEPARPAAFHCEIRGAVTVSVDADTVEAADPSWVLTGTGTEAATQGVFAGLTDQDAAWQVEACPGLGPGQRIVVRAALRDNIGGSVVRVQKSPPGHNRAELAALVGNALGRLAERAGCGLAAAPTPSVPPPGPTTDQVPVPDQVCVGAAVGPGQVAPPGTNPELRAWTPPVAAVRSCVFQNLVPFGYGSMTHEVATYSGPLVGLGATFRSQSVPSAPADAKGAKRIPTFRTTARCAGQEVTWVGIVTRSASMTEAGESVGMTEARGQYQRFVALHKSIRGCEVISGDGA